MKLYQSYLITTVLWLQLQLSSTNHVFTAVLFSDNESSQTTQLFSEAIQTLNEEASNDTDWFFDSCVMDLNTYEAHDDLCASTSSYSVFLHSTVSSHPVLSTVQLTFNEPLINIGPSVSCDHVIYNHVNNHVVDVAIDSCDVVIAIVDVVNERNWEEVLIFTDSNNAPYTSALVYQLHSHHIRSVTTTVDSSAPLTEDWFIANAPFLFTITNYITLLPTEQIRELVTMARMNHFDIVGPYYKWLLIAQGDYDTWTSDDVLDLFIEGDNVAVIQNRAACLTNEQHINNVIERWANDMIKNALAAIDQSDNATGSRPDNTDQSQERTDLTYGFGDNSQQIYETLYPQFNLRTLSIGCCGNLEFGSVGNWTMSTGLDLIGDLYPKLTQGFNNKTFVVSTIHYPPFVVKQPDGTFGGICFELLDEIGKLLNFSYTVVENTDGIYGVKLANGSFNGVVKTLQDKQADFAAIPMTIDVTRAEVIDFTLPYWEDPNIILMKRPHMSTFKIFICLGPFHLYVWLLLILSVFVTAFVLYLTIQYDPNPVQKVGSNTVDPHSLAQMRDPQIVVWQVFGALMQQGMVYIPTSHSSRIIIAGWWLYTIVMVGTYNGNLIAFLTAPTVTTPVNSLADLARTSMEFGIVRYTSLHGVLEAAEDGTDYMTLWQKVEQDPKKHLLPDAAQGLTRVLEDSNFIFIVEKSYYDTIKNKQESFSNKSCEYARGIEPLFYNNYAFPFPKGSPYTNEFSSAILHILRTGLMQRWKNKWYSIGNQCTGLERKQEQTNISLAEAQGAFFILGIGLTLALFTLVAERVVFYKYGSKTVLPNKEDLTENTIRGTNYSKTMQYDDGVRDDSKYGRYLSSEVESKESYSFRSVKEAMYGELNADSKGHPRRRSNADHINQGYAMSIIGGQDGEYGSYEKSENIGITNRRNKMKSKRKQQNISLTYNNAWNQKESAFNY